MEEPTGTNARRASAPERADTASLEELRAEVATLRAELLEQAAACNAALAAAQERLAWLDRLELDLDHTLSRRPVRIVVMGSLAAVRRGRRLRGSVRRRLSR